MDLQVAFFQFLNGHDTFGGTLRTLLKRTVAGGSSITGLTLQAGLGGILKGADSELSQGTTDFDLAAISFNTPGAPRAYDAARHFKGLGKTVIGGGPHCSLLAEEALQHFDAICIGPGDIQVGQMVSDAQAGKLKRAYHGTPGDWIVPTRGNWRGLSLAQLSRGCDRSCRMCVVPGLFGAGIDEKPLAMVKAELEHTAKTISIVDDNFPLNTGRGQTVLSLLKAFGKRFICQIRPDCALESGNLDRLANAGCMMVGVGLESIDPQSRIFLGKDPVDNPNEVIDRIHQAGMASYVNLVLGNDGESRDIFERTLRFVDDARPSVVSAHLLTPFPGTPLFAQFVGSDRLLFARHEFPAAWSFFDCRHVTFRPDPLSPEELKSGFEGFLKELYSLRSTFRRARKGCIGVSLLSSMIKNVW